MKFKQALSKGDIESTPIPNHEKKWCVVIKFDERDAAKTVIDELLFLSQEKSAE